MDETLDYWLAVWNIFCIFPYIGNNKNPNWRTHIFQRGRSTTNQIIYSYVGYPVHDGMTMDDQHEIS